MSFAPLLHRRARAFVAAALLGAALVANLAAPSAALADSTFKISGGGWGHGIGLSQYGARGYALKGYSYSWILAHYYQGTRLVTKPTVTVKVNLSSSASARSQWQIKAGSTTALSVVQVSDHSIKKTLDSTKTYWITTTASNTRLHADQTYTTSSGGTAHKPGTVLKTFAGACYASAGSMVQIVGSSGPFDHSGVRWRGTIRFLPATTTTSKAINYVNLEQYLYGVVPRESVSSWPTDALRAQAVAARSYAYQDGVEGNTLYCTTMSQVYNGQGRNSDRHETDSTNAAVDATKGQVVWYDGLSEPVKTFFSACTGGRTASIQDVWVGSSPQPYYQSVSDADQDSPYYRWSFNKTGKEIAISIRDKDNGSNGADPLEYSAPSPAIVTGFSFDKASSGYVRYVTVKWSNGASFKMRGTTFQSALGLRSSKFSVAALTFGTRYQQNDSRAKYSGTWTSWSNSKLSGGSYKYAKRDALAVFSFKGTGFRWISTKYPSGGRAEMYVDGIRQGSVSLYSSTYKYRQAIWTKTGLDPSVTHTVYIRVVGTKDAASSGTNVGVDAVEVQGGSLLTAPSPATSKRFEQTDSRMDFAGAWTTWQDSRLSGGSYAWSRTSDSSATIRFTGNRIRLRTLKNSTHGKAWVSIDGKPAVLVDAYAPEIAFQQLLWDSGTLTYGTHTVRFVPAEQKNDASTGYPVGIDCVDIWAGQLI